MEEIEICEDGLINSQLTDKHRKKKSKKKVHKSRKTTENAEELEFRSRDEEEEPEFRSRDEEEERECRSTEPELRNKADDIWKECSQNGRAKPWFVISVLGDSCSMVPMTWEKSLFQASLIEMAKSAKECWIIHEGGHGKLSQSVIKAVETHRIITDNTSNDKQSRGDNIKLVTISSTSILEENKSQDPRDQQFVVAGVYLDVHTEFLKNIFQSKVTILNLGRQELEIMIPVIVLLAEGDMDSLRHVDKILKQGTPVIIMKGTGKSADILIQYLESGKKIIKSQAQLLYGINFKTDDYKSLKSLMESIKKQKHLISVYDVNCLNDTLSETATNAILLSWNERRIANNEREDASEPDIGTNVDLIASLKYSDVDNQGEPEDDSRSQLSSIQGDSSGAANKTKNADTEVENWLSSSSFQLYFTIAYQHLQSEKEFRSQYFVQLLTKAIEADNIDYVTVLIQEHDVKFDHSCFPDLYKEAVECKFCKHDCRHLYAVLKKEKSHLGLFEKDQKSNDAGIEKSESQCIKVGRELCRQFLNYPKGKKIEETKSGESVVTENAKSENTDDNRYYQDLLIWSLFAHRPRLALLFWKWSEDKLVTALLAAALLKRMALEAIEVADKSVYEELLNHSRLFEQRSLKILERLYKEYPSEATNLMTSVSTVWDIDISPLRCAYESEFYDFVAHACSQRCLDIIWRNTQDASAGASQKTCSVGNCSRLLRAPRTQFIVHYIIFLAAVVTYSAFLLTNLKTTNDFGVYEICVYIWLFSDIIEEYLIPIFQRLKNPLRTTGHKYSLRRYMSDFWNVLDTVSFITTFVAIGLRFSDTTLPWARRVYSFSLFFIYMRFLHFILIFRKIGIYVILIKEMMKDLGRFLVILVVFMMAVGVMFHVNMYPNHQAMFSNKVQNWRIWKIISFPYWQIYGEILLDDIMGIDNSSCSYNQSDVERCVEYDWINIFIVAFYMLLSNLLLVNLVIALFSARFEKVRSNSKKIWSYIRYSYVMEYSVRVPAVVNLIVIMVIYGCVCCRKCKTQQVGDSSKQKKDQQKLQEKIRYIRTLQSVCSVRCT